ncbi:MAG: phosphoglucomutase [Bacteroidales bacterium]
MADPNQGVALEKTNITFGTDGWRGLLGDELNSANIERVAQAFSHYIIQKGYRNRVAIGFDGRAKSGLFANIFAEALCGNGINALLSDRIIPTPVISYTCRSANCDAGVMITASHNPPEYNGLKFKTAAGSPFPTEETATVEGLLDGQAPPKSIKTIERIDMMLPYIRHIESLIDFAAIRDAGLKVAIDSMGGAGNRILEDMLVNHEIVAGTIYSDAQPDFSGRLAEPIEANLEPLSLFLQQGDYSLGVATDGDADRLGVMTDKGKWMNIQECIWYLSHYYLNERKVTGPLVKTASVSDKLRLISKDHDVEVIDVPVGFKYVAETMMEKDAAFGAEESGGFGFKDHIPDRDGIFSALIFLEMMAKAGYDKLEDFIRHKRRQYGSIYYERTDIHNNNPGRYQVLPHLADTTPLYVDVFPVSSITPFTNSRGRVNGLKFHLQGNPRWLLIRVSETEPIIRFYAEGENPDEVKRLLKAGQRMFSEHEQAF